MPETLTGLRRDTLDDVVRRVVRDLNGKLPGSDAALPMGILPGVRLATSAAEHALYGAIDLAAAQSTELLATGPNLDIQGAKWGVTRKAASRSVGVARFTGDDGAVVAAGLLLRRADGVQYQTIDAGQISGGVADVAIQAITPGADPNAGPGVTLTPLSPIGGADSSATALDALIGGAAAEQDGDPRTTDTATYRGRILFRIQNPPGAGKPSDYIRWALEVPGVTRVWVYPEGAGPQSVVLLFMMDETYADGVPVGLEAWNYLTGSGDPLAVFQYIAGVDRLDPARLSPIGARVYVAAPTPAPLVVKIANLEPNTPAVQAAIRTSIADMLQRRAEPGGVIWLSWISEAISVAAGEARHTLTEPTDNVTHAANEIAIYDPAQITFV
ncbi:MAG: baseplate J/gp47 family protein [Pseudomonadota bacterium]